MKMIPLAAATLATALPVAVTAQMSTNPQVIQAGTYNVESHHTLARFSVNHFGFNDFFGVMPDATGTLVLTPEIWPRPGSTCPCRSIAFRPPTPSWMAS